MDLTVKTSQEGTLPEEICYAPRAKMLSTCDLGNSDCSCCEQCSAGGLPGEAQVCDFFYEGDSDNIFQNAINFDSIPEEVRAGFLGYDLNSTEASF